MASLVKTIANLGGLAGWCAVRGIDLDEVAGRHRALPHLFIEAAIDRDALGVQQSCRLNRSSREGTRFRGLCVRVELEGRDDQECK
jgi:hypothetical protein